MQKGSRHSGKLTKLMKSYRHSSKKAGAPPGTLQHMGEQKIAESQIFVTDFSKKSLESSELENISKVFPYLDRETITWVQIHGLHEIELIQELGTHMNFHPLVQEDILNTGQRPKKEDYKDYIFFVIRMLHYNEEKDEILSEQLSLILGNNYVISFQESDFSYFDIIKERLKQENGRLRNYGPDYLAYALLDIVVDYYFGVLEFFGDKVEQLEYELLENPDQSIQQKIHEQRREQMNLRKAIWPLRDVMNTTIRDESDLITDNTKVFFRDIYDHIVLIIDMIETNRDIIMGMFDTYMSSISNKMNEVMKVLTIIATIFIPLTFIAGIYGMNFNPEKSPYNMPELNAYFGYPIAMLVMFIIAVGMVFYFKKKRWL